MSAASTHEPSPGDRLSKDLVLVRPLMQGGMGTVWIARHEGLGSDVAVKLLTGNLADDEVIRKRFAREAAAAMDVQSPHVVQMLDYGIADDGAPYLVMELLDGEDLEGTLQSGPLPAKDVVSIVTQVGQALHRAHEKNILHRDLKPANVFLLAGDGFSGERFFVKLIDFGFAKRVDKMMTILTEQGMIVGTPQYMSPEQLQAQKLDPRSDLFSLGSIAFEAFTGKRPFDGEGLRDIADAIQVRPLPLPTHLDRTLPPALDAWFLKACARKRDERFASAKEMVSALQQVFARPAPGVASGTAAQTSADEEPAPEGRVLAERAPSRFTRNAVIAALILAAIALFAWIVPR